MYLHICTNIDRVPLLSDTIVEKFLDLGGTSLTACGHGYPDGQPELSPSATVPSWPTLQINGKNLSQQFIFSGISVQKNKIERISTKSKLSDNPFSANGSSQLNLSQG